MERILSSIAAIQDEAARGNVTEHTVRPALKTLLESGESGISVTNEPRRSTDGAPDEQLARGPLAVGHARPKTCMAISTARRAAIRRRVAALYQ